MRNFSLLLWMAMLPALATPQTSDADLKVAQLPVISLGATPDFKGIRTAVSGDYSAGGGMDISSFGPGITHLDLSGISAVGGESSFNFSGATGIAALSGLFAIAFENSVALRLSACGITDATDAMDWFNSANNNGVTLDLSNNPITSGININNSGGLTGSGGGVALNNCGLTTVGLGNIVFTSVSLQGNAIAAIDLSGIGYAIFTTLNLSANPITTITPGDGISSGITNFSEGALYFNGCALGNAQEDGLLAALVSMEANVPGNDATLDISGGTNAVPDSTGAADVATLVAAGWFITTN